MKLIVIAIFSLLTMTGCKNSNHKAMTTSKSLESSNGYANVNGIKMYYEIHGTGETISSDSRWRFNY